MAKAANLATAALAVWESVEAAALKAANSADFVALPLAEMTLGAALLVAAVSADLVVLALAETTLGRPFWRRP